ncbi:MAG: peptide-methionine (S)-S-oxide reductase MsrA [Planctomycetales bacterium]|nr:peptide-methionine (S)-S-oxide reductase MsrA [Planctomycetales bacterium]
MRLKRILNIFAAVGCLLAYSPFAHSQQQQSDKEPQVEQSKQVEKKEAVATFGGGCFWCVEAVFENMQGVTDVVSGYAGGRNAHPTYAQVCTGRTGHAEVCQIHYDPQLVSFAELLEVFWKTHDPTTLNRQGNDYGTQYRSVVFYHDEQQRKTAEEYKQKLDDAQVFANKIVTEISPLPTFYVAEDYHQDYYRNNPQQGYCAAVVRPKVEKFKKVFADKVKE